MTRTRLILSTLIVGALGACTESASDAPLVTGESAVVYGNDDRQDWYAHPDEALRTLTAESIVSLIRPGNLDESNPADVRITAGSVGESRNFCEGERFYDDPRAANCSGTLIDDDLVLTAGHCVDDLADCRNYRYVFDYYYESEGVLATITADDVYTCADVLVRRNSGGIDYAIVQLDRQVTLPHRPAAVHLVDEARPDGSPVTIIGFGSGMPAKIDNGGSVVDPRADTLDYFNATTDAFGGNSGSGVFNASREVIGILVRGATDYVTRDGCTVVNVLPEDSDGEDIVYVGRAIEALCASDYVGPLCGGPRGYCRTCETSADCIDGWSCAEDAAGELVCTAPCAADADCRDDHACDGAFCRPRVAPQCSGGDVWSVDACGRQVESIEACGAGALCMDAACVAAGEGDGCDVVTYLDIADQTVTGTLDDTYTDRFEGDCGGQGRDRVWAFTLTREMEVTATATGFDTVLHLRSVCGQAGTEITCDDDSNPPGDRGSRISETLDPGTFFIVLDSFANPGGGDYTFDISFTEVCECEEDAVRCQGGGVQTCIGTDAVCPTWSEPEPCGAGETCFDAACVAQSSGDVCEDAIAIEAVGQVLTGDLSTGFGDDGRGSCGGAGPDAIYTFTLVEPAIMTALADGFDTVLHVRSDCADPETEVGCDDDERTTTGGNGSLLEAELEAGSYALFMDAFGDEVGEYQLTLAFERACFDQCEPDQFVCVSPVSYRQCGQFDDDSCWDWDTTVSCPGEQRCSEFEQACIDPGSSSDDVGVPDAGDDTSGADAGTDTGGVVEADASDADASGRGRSSGCAAAPRAGSPLAMLSVTGALFWLRRRRATPVR